MSALRVLLADDHPLYRAGLRLLLDNERDFTVVAEVGNVGELFEQMVATSPDVVILDVAMPPGSASFDNGIDAANHLAETHPATAILMLTMFDDRASVSRALRAGAGGYLVKGAGGDEVLRAVRAVASGQVILDGHVSDVLMAEADPLGGGQFALTNRESDILHLMASGLTNMAIANTLYLSEKTVRNYISGIFRKLGAANRMEAIVLARDAGFG